MKIKLSEMKTKSNMLSAFRLLLAVPLWFLLNDFGAHHYLVAVICVVGVATDLLDGFLARKFNEITEMGKIIDPLADKICIAVVVIQLFLHNKIDDYYFYMIIIRDILIFLGGIYVTSKIGKVLPSDYIGKGTVLSIGIIILFTLMGVEESSPMFLLVYFVSLFMIVFSLVNYLLRAIKTLKKKKK